LALTGSPNKALNSVAIRNLRHPLAHVADPLAADLASEHWAEPVPPEGHRLVANIDARSNSRSSSFRSECGNFTYIITTRRMISGEELK
jgi:hypothetical protein